MKKNAKKAESRLLDTVLSNLDGIDSYTISSLAKEAEVSYATVCRMLEKIGVSGFKEFKSVISEGAERSKGEKTACRNDITCAKTAEAVYREAEDAIKNCRGRLKGELLDKTVKMLSEAGTVMFTGMGNSAVSARYAYTAFFGVLPQCFYSSDMIMAKMKASILNKGDVLLAVSASGKTKPVIEAAKVARSSGAAVICLTDYDLSPLSDVSDIAVSTGAGTDGRKTESESHSVIGQITAINVLFGCVKEQFNQNKKESRE